jgi:rod shape-determining protein MreB
MEGSIKVLNLFNSFSKDMGIDLGTANTLVYMAGKGIIIREPSVVAVNINTKKVLAVGAAAKQMIGRTPGYIAAIRPLKGGVIADFDITQTMLRFFIKKAVNSQALVRPRIVIGVPSGVTPVEKRAVVDAAMQAGAREAFVIEEPLAAAMGAGIAVQDAAGSMVVDIGGGTTEVAIISSGGIVVSQSIRIAGDEMDEAIVQYAKKKFNLLIGIVTAEKVKVEIGTALDVNRPASTIIRGRDMVTGLPKTMTINQNQIREALQEPLIAIVDVVKSTLEKTPPDLATDIMNKGIVMTGGTSLLRNLDRLLHMTTGIPVVVSEDALSCVAIGTGIALKHLDKLNKGIMGKIRKL